MNPSYEEIIMNKNILEVSSPPYIVGLLEKSKTIERCLGFVIVMPNDSIEFKLKNNKFVLLTPDQSSFSGWLHEDPDGEYRRNF